MSRVLITGGTGFIGSRLADVCLQQGDNVRIMGQANTLAEQQNLSRLRDAGFDVVEGSVTNRMTLEQAMRDVQVVYHLAAAQHEAGQPDQHFYEVNVTGTQNVLEAALATGVGRLVHGSTIGVYQAAGQVVHEDSPTIPDNIYGTTKLAAEKLVSAYSDRLSTVMIRISETYGPGDRRLLKLFRAVRRKRYIHIGRGGNLHHPIYIDDLVAALRSAATAEIATGQIIVTPGFESLTTRQMVEAIAESVEVSPPRRAIPLGPLWAAATLMETALRPWKIQPPLHRRRMHFFTKSYQFSGEPAGKLLNFQPQVPFREGAERTAQWYRENGLLN